MKKQSISAKYYGSLSEFWQQFLQNESAKWDLMYLKRVILSFKGIDVVDYKPINNHTYSFNSNKFIVSFSIFGDAPKLYVNDNDSFIRLK